MRYIQVDIKAWKYIKSLRWILKCRMEMVAKLDPSHKPCLIIFKAFISALHCL